MTRGTKENAPDNGAQIDTTAQIAAPLVGPQATVQGYTGRFLVLIDPNEVKPAVRAFHDGAGVKASAVAADEAVDVSVSGIPEGEAMIFGDLGVAVVNAAPDQARGLSTAVANNESLQAIEQERFVYATEPADMSYLRGFRDAVNHLYDKLSESDGVSGPVAAASGILGEQQFTWGLQVMNVPGCRYSGKPIPVAVLDTGIDLAHPDFQGRAIKHASFIDRETVQDGHGHGTHCAGVLAGPFQPRSGPRYGVGPHIDLIVGKVLGDSGRGTDSTILAGIRWAIAQGARIISMSLGSPVQAGDNYSFIFEQVASRALLGGTLIIAAAGNDSKRRLGDLRPVSHPANCPSIMAVAAVDRDLRPADFSNAGMNTNGGKVDISGPGVDVLSAYPGQQQYRRLDGTSMATPAIAGIAALYAEAYPGLTGDGLWARLVQQALPLPAPTRDVGAGLAQAPR